MDRRRMLQGAACAMGTLTTPCLAAPERTKINFATLMIISYVPAISLALLRSP